MSHGPFSPTEEQKRVIGHEGSAYVSACPGAGKTRVLVERGRALLKDKTTAKGVAFLSFTNAAVSELERRLRQEGLLPFPAFPHFIGTFDSFLWQFLIAPFGVPGYEGTPRLIPDKEERTVRPFEKLRELPLKCFDRATGALNRADAKRYGFDSEKKKPGQIKAYERIAASARDRSRNRGELDFEDVRVLAAGRLKDETSAPRLAVAFGGRFREVIVDEAQDCNPVDIEIIRWLRDAGITTKVICDPHQSIYGFRGGVAEELSTFGQTFAEGDRLPLSGNFRSSEPICRSLGALRPSQVASLPDRALGGNKSIATPIQVLGYSGHGVPATVGERFRKLVATEGFDLALCPVVAATWTSAKRAAGQPLNEHQRKDLTLRLACAVSDFYCSFDTSSRLKALEMVHRVVLEIEDRIGENTYREFLTAEGLEAGGWRPRILWLVRELRWDPETYPSSDAWHDRAKALLEPYLRIGGPSIARRLPRNQGLSSALSAPNNVRSLSVRSIHSVKGMEFPAVCVVMSVKTARGIFDYIESGQPACLAEESREIYVGASRAQRLLVIASPKSQVRRLVSRLAAAGAAVEEDTV